MQNRKHKNLYVYLPYYGIITYANVIIFKSDQFSIEN